ncbi:MAG: hypothetical protein EAX90_15525 [Candidatus Heimdallarchaeota archaeon]|nr:hypothetical protein [Candidatus Heimdallarchaeota archaeon]
MTLPDSIINLTALEKLYLFNNKLNSLPEYIGCLKSLQELNLDHNKLILILADLKRQYDKL